VKLDTSKILVLAPHTDDEIHCMGSVIEMLDRGADVHVHAFSSCEDSIPEGLKRGAIKAEFMKAMEALSIPPKNFSVGSFPVRRFDERRQSILNVMIGLRGQISPTLVFCPSSTDCHQDHRVVHEEAIRAFRNCSALLGWEAPHNQRVATTNVHLSISQNSLDGKIEHWRNYKSQGFRGYFNEDFLRALAIVRGAQMRNLKTGLAEAFEMLAVNVR